MLLCSNNGTYQIFDNHHDEMLFFHYYETILNVYIKHFRFKMTHNILDMDNIYV